MPHSIQPQAVALRSPFESFDLNASFDKLETAVFRIADGSPLRQIESDDRHSWPDLDALAQMAFLASKEVLNLISREENVSLLDLINNGLANLEDVRAAITTMLLRFPTAFVARTKVFGSTLSNTETIENIRIASPPQLLSMFRELAVQLDKKSTEHPLQFLQLAAYSGCLKEIDLAVLSLIRENGNAIVHTIAAHDCFVLAQSVNESALSRASVISGLARKARNASLESDPKQSEKRFVRQCWQAWIETPSRYRSKAAFARDMLEKCQHLTSSKVIEDWCREWEESEPNASSEHQTR
jgi:hypothetical protein